MKLLEAEPLPAAKAAPEGALADAGHDTDPQPAARACRSCGAALAPEQDWCLVCGSAVGGGRRTRLPGWSTVATVLALTLVLVAGAGAASYAALTDEPAPLPQAAAATPTDATPAPTDTTPTDTAPTDTGTTGTTTDPAQDGELPTIDIPETTDPIPSPTPTPTDDAPFTPTDPTPTDDGATDEDPGAEDRFAADRAIELPEEATAVYDPYGRAPATGDPARAVDGNRATSWYLDPKDPTLVGSGYAIDLGDVSDLRALELVTSTPGFRVEIYASDQVELPPNILDTRWTHLRDVEDVGVADPDDADAVEGRARIVLPRRETRYRHVLLWFTQSPSEDAPRLRITELELFS